MGDNPLERHFRRSQIWLRLPSGGRWYRNGEVSLNESLEVQIRGTTAIDEMMLNTPDAMLNGHALEGVIRSCAPDVQDVKKLVQPDVEAILLGIKAATNRGKFEISRTCTECGHDNTFDVICTNLLNGMTYVEDSDTQIEIDGQLVVHFKPYSYDARTTMIHRQLMEQRTIDEINKGEDEDTAVTMDRVAKLADSVERMAKLTFSMIADAITSIEMLHEGIRVSDRDHINEWLNNIDRSTANAVTQAVEALNQIGPPRSIRASCQACSHEWDEPLAYDPTLFFTRP